MLTIPNTIGYQACSLDDANHIYSCSQNGVATNIEEDLKPCTQYCAYNMELEPFVVHIP